MPNQPTSKPFLITLFMTLAVITLLLLTTLNLQNYLSKESKVQSASTSLEDEAIFWKDFLIKNPNYLPGWEEYAKINYLLGNNDEVVSAIEKIYQIDPNYKPESKDNPN